jgi:TolB-like protein/class 3 adenylate cyclase
VTEQRRLAAIVSADVAGYARLMGRDESGTLAALKAIRQELVDPAIASHGGRIVKTTGDGLLLEFPSVVNAVRCAVEVQAAMVTKTADVPEDRRIAFRIGINQGDIIIEGDDIFGDGVNVAARLQEIAAPGGICVSSRVHEDVRDRLDTEFDDGGTQTLKNIARPVRVWRWLPSMVAPQKRMSQRGSMTPSPPFAPHLSIVVLPFENIGGDPEQDYFADGVTESLTTDLSRISGSFVIARNTAFSYKGRAIDIKQIGHQLNVRYVLEGAVQRGGNRFRVNVQLIDAETGNHIWADRFDKPVADLFDMQDEIVSRLANALDAELIAAEARQAERSVNPDAMDLVFQGRAWRNKGLIPDHMVRARGFFERAMALDPENIEAMVGLAFVDLSLGAAVMTDDWSARFAAAEVTLTKVLSRAPSHPRAHLCLGNVKMNTKRVAQGIAECEQALALDRNAAGAHALIGLAKLLLGRGAETEAHINEAFRLSPRDTLAHRWMVWVGLAKAHLNFDSEAVVWLRRGIDANRNYAFAHFHLAAALARLGELDQARAAMQAGLALDPSFTVRRYLDAANARSDNPTYLAGCERAVVGMRMAGVPEE